MEKQLTPDEIIDAIGGTSVVAELCDVSDAAVSQWRTADGGIPKSRLMFLRLARPKVFASLDAIRKSKSKDESPSRANTRRAANLTPEEGRASRQPPATNRIFDTVPDHAAVGIDAQGKA
ncbi:hypothetical protein [Janthinobacterium sp. LB2P10]|uniref:hypothetical protein n=1 Tax=Janthinobacterium sp. LB2P10 TaxID=3424194 RepID=UPI003F24245E